MPGPGRVALLAGCTALAAYFMLWNLRDSPDTQYDEVVYTRADQAVAQGWHLTWNNRPLFVHPPLSFLAQAAWLRLFGVAERPLIDIIPVTRLLAALVTVVNILLVAMLAHRLMPDARPLRRAVLTLAITVLAATDPILLRYGRMAMIEPFALFGCLVTLHLAIALRLRRPAVYVPIVGLATGLALLTKEVGIFIVLTPLLYAMLCRDRSLVLRNTGALLAGLALWLTFPVWAMRLGLFSSFVEIKTSTAQRLVGVLQTTGWNRPGVSFLGAVRADVDQYLSSYVLLACGALALVWMLVHQGGGTYRWLLAWLLASYAYGAYVVLLGTLNEQFFVYVVPAAVVATVLIAEAVLGSRVWSMGVGLTALAAVLVAATVSWGRFYVTDNDGVARLTAYVNRTLPRCAVINVNSEFFRLVMPGRTLSTYATGPGALSHGVNLFVLSDKNAKRRFGNASPAITSWVRAHGVKLASYPSTTYYGLELWQVNSRRYDPLVGVERFPGGDFVITKGSRCGGFTVTNSTNGRFASLWAQLGGKAVAGPPLTSSWTIRDRGYQVFAGAVLTSISKGEGRTKTTAIPIVKPLATTASVAYRQAKLPPLAHLGSKSAGAGTDAALLTDSAISHSYRSRLAPILGQPLGPPAQMPDGRVRQAFAAGVLERPTASTIVRMAPVGKLVVNARLIVPTSQASRTITPPALPVGEASARPTTVKPFVWSLTWALAIYVAIAVVIAKRPRRPLSDVCIGWKALGRRVDQ